MSSLCDRCDLPRSCCSEYSVFVSLKDVLRIRSTLNIPFDTFVQALPITPETRDYRPYSFSLGDRQRFLLALKSRGASCIFLLRFGSHFRCGIHPERPIVCRCYPFMYEENILQEIPGILCPSSWPLTKIEKEEFKNNCLALQDGYSLSQAISDEWNLKKLPELKKALKKGTTTKVYLNHFFEFIRSRES